LSYYWAVKIFEIIALPSAKGERKKIDLENSILSVLRTANFRLSVQKLFFDFKNPYKIIANAEPERSEGEATTLKNAEIVNWRCLLVKIRTFFDENPDFDF
jgi:hypothetical protein